MSKKKLAGIIVACIIGIIVVVAVATSGEPTSTPPVTPPTPTPLTTSEQVYATTIADHSNKVSNAMYELSNLMSNPQIGNDEWTLKVASQLAAIRVLYDEAMEVEPPSSMTDIHYKYVQAMKHFETATHLIAEGVDTRDANLLNQATTELTTGNQLINEATNLLEEFKEAHGI